MSNSTAQVLMKKGKRGAAAYIHADCASGSPQHLGPLLDVLLNPSKAIDEWETIDWCRWLIAGGRTPDEFATVVRSYDKHDKCGLVWIPRVVAYRCRTCGISPCMSICRECFHRGDHSTHDFNMFLSQAGGACDCGDNSVMKEDGFCSNHGNKCPRPGTAPAELMCVAEGMMPRLILRLLQHFRENSWGSATNSDSYRRAVNECEGYVNMLMELNNMGDLMRSAMTKALINPQMYRNLAEPPFPPTEYGQYMAESKKMYEKAIESFPAPEPPDEYKHLPALSPHLQHNTLLDEFIFWTFKYEFPQNIVCFLLNMLPDQDYKEHLTRTFVLHYARIPLVLEAAADPDTLSNRVVHMSVQLFSNEALALRCVEQLHLLHVMVLSLKMMMGKILVQNTLHDPEKNFHYVIDCTRRVMKEHCYWPLVSDFNNVLSHGSVALRFLQDDSLLDMWFDFLSMLQGMNVNVRETSGHIEFEPSSYYAAFSCELEAAAYPMWSVLSHLTGAEHAGLARRVLHAATRALAAWLRVSGAAPRHECGGAHASFHFPLHRHLAAFLCCGVRALGLRAADLLPPHRALLALAAHPLATQALFYEILAGIWVRNGLQIKGQAMTYIQANFCNSMVDMDIYWLQICAAHLPPDDFINMCIDTFNVREWLSLEPMSPAQLAEQDAMVEGLLTFLAILVSSRTNLGNDELTQSRLEVSTLLAAGDKTHSQLLELMPERSGNAHTRNFETVLKEVSRYRAPPRGSETLEQGLFVPTGAVWERYYDPLHVLRRAVHRRDYHASMERFTAYVKEKQKAEGGAGGGAAEGGALWPPLRDPPPAPAAAGDPSNLCNSGVLCGAVLGVLARYGAGRGAGGGGAGGGGAGGGGAGRAAAAGSAPPDHVLALAVYLLYSAVRAAPPDRPVSWSCVPAGAAGAAGGAGAGGAGAAPPLLSALRGNVCTCARTHVHSVPRARAPPARRRTPSGDAEREWEQSPPPAPGRLAPPATSTALVVPPPMQMVRRMDTDTDDQSDSGGDPPQIRSLEQESRSAILALVLQSLEEREGREGLAGREGREGLAGREEDAHMSLALPAAPRSPPAHEHDFDIEPEWSLTIREESPSRTPALPAPEPTTSTDTQLQVHQENEEDDMIVVNESIISLLLKLHSQLSGKLDSFSLDEPEPERELPIGDGCYWVGRVLHALCARDAQCGAHVQRVRAALWPRQRERQAELAARERREKEERSRRARARQDAVMAEFARRQQQFLHAMTTMDCGDEAESETPEDYHCVICNTTALSTAAHPLGRAVLLQSTSVAGHGRSGAAGGARLALTEAERCAAAASAEHSRAAHHARAARLLHAHFAPDAWPLAVSAGWAGGVHVASCGHHLHVRCLAAYLRSLAAPARPHNLHVERGEFLCPVCRQLANSVLPLSPGGGAARARAGAVPSGTPHRVLAAHVQDMLDRERPHPPPATKLSEAMGKAMEDMTAQAGAKLKQEFGTSPAALFTFVASLVRTQLECELVQRGGNLVAPAPHAAPRYKPRNECLVPLIEVVSAHARVLVAAGAQLGAADTWRQLCGPDAAPDGTPDGAPGVGSAAVPCAPRPRAVPLLLKDPLALLMHFILLAPLNPPYLDIQHFICIVRALYALTYYQIVCQFLARVGPGGRASMATYPEGTTPHPITQVAAQLMQALSGSELFTEDGPATHDNVEHIEVDALEEELQELLLPYLRICSLLRHHVYGDKLPGVGGGAQEFVQLTYYLELVGEGVAPAQWSAARALPPHHAAHAHRLALELRAAAPGGQLLVRRLLSSAHVRWLQPALVSLPRDYERLFSYYHERVCAQCGAAPKEASVCLLCGTLVCLKQPCCRRQQVCEAVQHAMECGGGTGIFLVVTSTYIIVIRGRRACLWGSLYLDDYDEEDRDLKRGKPLYLSQDRLELLQAQWLAHRFDHTKRTWVWHRDSL